MNPREKGFLLLTSHLGTGPRPVLTAKQLEYIGRTVRDMPPPEADRPLTAHDLIWAGLPEEMAVRVVSLLEDEPLLESYVSSGAARGCTVLSRVSPGYPLAVRRRLGYDSPGCLWAKGDLSVLGRPCISLVGSRELRIPNAVFAQAVGTEAARQGFALVSGNARGADRTAQESCLKAGGSVIVVVADRLDQQPLRQGVLYLSEDSFDLPFSAHRALRRNRIIHSLGQLTFVAQASLGKGGTWSGTRQNLLQGWSPVFCFADGSPAAAALCAQGAEAVRREQLADLPLLMKE